MTIDNVLVVKLGGGEGLDLEAACDDLARIACERPLVVVHGVSTIMNQLCTDMGIEVQSLTSPSGHSSRYTPPAVRDIYVRAAEMANEQLVAALRSRGVYATGFVGGNVALCGERKKAIRAIINGRTRVVRDDHSGSIRDTDSEQLVCALKSGHVPVLPPMAQSADGLLNVDGDRAGAAVAGALNAKTLVILSNVSGLYHNFPDEDSIVAEVKSSETEQALEWAQGRMKRKVLAAQEALNAEVETVVIGDGRIESPVSAALSGGGTRFTK